MRTIATIVLMTLALCAAAQETRQKPVTDSVGNYVVQYQINPDAPLFETDSIGHYEAIITVFEIKDGDTTQVYQPLRGIYADGECVCDNPAKIVKRHRELNKAEQ